MYILISNDLNFIEKVAYLLIELKLVPAKIGSDTI